MSRRDKQTVHVVVESIAMEEISNREQVGKKGRE